MASISPTAAVLCALVLFAAAGAEAKKAASTTDSPASSKRTGAGPKNLVAAALHLRSLDLVRRVALIDASGLHRPPTGNLFTFTDERDRHFVAMGVRCQNLPSGTLQCELDLPAGYERHRLVSLTLHLHGLHGSTVAAESAEIETAWNKAESEAEHASARVPAAVPAAPMSTAPKGPPPKREDAGQKGPPPAPSDAGTLQKEEEEPEDEPE